MKKRLFAASLAVAIMFLCGCGRVSYDSNECVLPSAPMARSLSCDIVFPVFESDSPAGADIGSPDIDLISVKAESALYIFRKTLEFEAKRNSFDNSGFIYYNQGSEEYGDIAYGNQTMRSYGCGPTNMAMVLSTLLNKPVTPLELARFSEQNGCFVSGAGTAYSFFSLASREYGINYAKIYKDSETVLKYLKQGCYIICTMGPGYFSKGGHFVTLRGVTDDGSVLIADSYSVDNSVQKWKLEFLFSQLKSSTMWLFYE